MEFFQPNYEMDVEYIVPQSLVVLYEAFDYVMIHVLAFRRGIEDVRSVFKKKYGATTRDFELNMDGARNKEAEKKKVGEQNVTDRNQLKNSALETFKEVIIELVHVKVLKAVIDSNLRFGGPENFATLVLVYDKSREARIVQELIKAFAEKEKLSFYGTKEQLNDTEDFFPFVYAAFNFNLQ
jgi:V-type H+-transporting ATPase subunit C